ncbi:MAG: DNA methylase [Tannerellaceae bacterium]|jgi:hypothetical protein|nr:DNA methylase [Tannerellaceae bacterium]
MEKQAKIKESEPTTIRRLQINFAPYNPKKHSKEAVAEQRRNLKRVGYLGGIVWNKTTGNLVSGHKRVMAFDLEYKYDGTPETDYDIRVEVVEMDEKTEKEQNIYMDAQGTNTQQDYELLAQLIPEIDYKNAGLTEEDLNFIGVDYLLQTEGESNLSDEIENMMSGVNAQKEIEREARIAHNKAIKEQVKKSAEEKAENMDAYVTLSFDTNKAKASFMKRFGYNSYDKFIKGEVFDNQIERVG